MHRNFTSSIFFLFTFLVSIAGIAQDRDSSTTGNASPDTATRIIGEITVIGNKITKEHIIFRELAFKPGDTLSSLDFNAKRIRSEENLYNTSLFNSAKLTYLEAPDGTTSIYVILKERWY